MPLPTPILDDRTWSQLREELVRNIAVYTPEWTDHNASDPGITLLELFAFLGEDLLFRFNQIPEATRLAFLRLLHIPLRAAQSAETLLTFSTEAPSGVHVPVRSEARAGETPFETTVELTVWPVSSRTYCRATQSPPDPTSDAGIYAAAAQDAAELEPGEKPAYYVNQQVPEDPMAPSAAPVDFSSAVDGMIWIAVLAEEGADVTKMTGKLLNVGLVPDSALGSMDDGLLACPGLGRGAQRPDLLWEISTGAFTSDGEPVYRSLSVRGDTTGGLTRPGVVRLELPKDSLQMRPFDVGDPDLEGTRTLPPLIEDEEVADKVLFWIRAFRNEVTQPLPRLEWVGVNVTHVMQCRTVGPYFLGTGNGQPRQVFPLASAPVVERSLELDVEEGGRFLPWTEVADFDASSSDSRHFIVDREAGTVEFGNGLRGRAPQIGERVRARRWRVGGGEAGNVAAGAIRVLPQVSDVEAVNPLPGRGGAEGESVGAGLERVPGELRRRDRAMAASDFAELALATPGAAVGRAETLALFHPPTRALDAAGVVSVVVWPQQDRKSPAAPMPDRTLVRTVCEWLDARRLVTTELWVIPPTYRRISIAIGVAVKEGYGIEAVRSWVEQAVRQYLSVLPPFGPEGKGWPLGRSIDAREVEAAALQVEGVAFLSDELRVAEWNAKGGRWIEPARRVVALSPWEVPELAELSVVEGAALTPGEAVRPAVRAEVPVPIPTLREEC